MNLVDNQGATARAALLAGTLLVLGLGSPSAAADIDASIPVPDVQTVQVDKPQSDRPDAPVNVTVTFTDRAEDDTGYLIEIREKNSLDNIVSTARVPSVPGVGRVATQVVGGVPPGGTICADAVALVDDDQSPTSAAVCANPAKQPTDLALQNIRGKAEQDWNNVKDISPAYLVAFSNPGGAEATDIVVDIATSGVATIGDQSIVPTGWDGSGFTCATRPPAGGENAGLRCTGGHLAAGEQANPAVIIRFTGPGYGTIHASISGADDKNASNNGTALNIRVY